MILRPMTMADADKMLEWKNYAETRKFAIVSHGEIKKEDHLRWLEKNIQYFQVIQGKNAIYGAIRIQDKEISVWVDRNFRNNRVATIMVNSIAEKGMLARIVEGNIASMRVFIRAGFKPISYENRVYIFQK